MPSLPVNAGKIVHRIPPRFYQESGTSIRDKTVNGVPVEVGTVPVKFIRAHETRLATGRDLSKFHKRRNSGELLPYTRYDYIQQDVEWLGPPTLIFGYGGTSPTEFRRYWSDGSSIPMTHMVGTNRLIASPSNYLDTVLGNLGVNPWIYTQAAAAKLYGRGWDGLTFLAELHHIVRMFRSLFPRLISLAGEIVNILKSGGFARLGFSSMDDWLAARYGWRILLYDIRDIQKLIDDFDEEQRSRVKDRTGDTLTYSETFVEETSGSHHIVQSYTTEVEVLLRGSIIADFVPARISINPVVTLWELVPFSFVIDWIVGVGRALEALSFLVLNSQYTCALGVEMSATQTMTTSVDFAGPPWTDGGYSNFDELEFTNEFVVRRRRPTRVSALPSLNINLDGFKVLDLVALLLQRLR